MSDNRVSRFDDYHKVFTAEKVHLYVQQQLTDYPGMAHNTQTFLRDAADRMVMQMTTWCVSGRVSDRVSHRVIEYPDGVWQMFKEKYLPHWFVRWFPVRNVSIKVVEEVHHYFMCPHLVTDDHSQHVQFMATGSRFAPWFGGKP